MYIDLIVLVVLILVVIMFFRRFSSFVFFIAIVEMFFRILSFIKNNIGLPDVAALINKYIPNSFFDIIDTYTNGILNIIFKWVFVVIMIFFLSYTIKIFFNKKKI